MNDITLTDAVFGAPSRRSMLKAGGFIALGFSLLGPEAFAQQQGNANLQGDLKQWPKISSWLRINADQTVTLLVGKVELGQGILTAVSQLCADELDIDIKRLKLISGDTALVPDEGVTAGSFSMPNCGTAVRQVSAEARALLLSLAAKSLGTEAATLKVADGKVTAPDGKSVTYWDLVKGQELEVQASGTAAMKPASERRYIGKPFGRVDIPAKVTGTAIYVHDYRPAGMVHGRVVRPPAARAKLAAIDAAAVESMPGVIKVVRDGSFLGVVARREEQALAAASKLSQVVKWDVETGGPTSETIYDWLLATPSKDTVIKDQKRSGGPAPAATVEQTYKRPYQMHGTIGPSTAVATYDAAGSLLIQTHSQSVFETGTAIAKMLGLEPSKVRCQHMQGSGCYGHNGADDVAADAALLARAVPGTPVRVQWSRRDEHKWEPYGSAMLLKVKADVDADGNILDWTYDLWSTSHGVRPSGQAGNMLAAGYLEKPFERPVPVNGGPPNYAADRNAIALYEFPGQKVTTHFITQMPVRASSTRGLGAYANVFAIESSIDELAARAKADPVEYRLRYLKDQRGRDVLTKAAEAFGWSKWEKKAGHGRGIAFARYKNLAAFTAIAMEVSVDPSDGSIKVLRATIANDSGEIVNPDGIANQLEGGLIQSLSWSLKEAVKFDGEGIRSSDWEAYPILTFEEVPHVDIVHIDRPNAPFLGTGEASQGPTAAALANAIFDACGVRFRDLPFTPDRIKAGLPA
ncbi:molybdopterin cofactor-binding domain-containing protein [uncultured Alsobacter sp.]|uniref:xanthine dehydrogenase family protein molybdopterin-binding subunit n=1 Tax=uncultured Alsobacter sp. TaxID=1748258 RepID=UPI0025DCC598|nr:molybdopterin cofactor-binding domain-containing protein [uncultured Alsobacter sp.]